MSVENEWIGLKRREVAMAGKRKDRGLTDNEGALLSVVERRQPITAYRVIKHYAASPVKSYNSGKGHVYPMLRRLEAEGLLKSTRDSSDARGTEYWTCTAKGVKELKRWIKRINSTDLLPVDPLRTKVTSFHLLDHDEQIAWILEVKDKLAAKLDEIEAHDLGEQTPFREVASNNSKLSTRARMEWLDQLMFEIVKDARSQRKK